MFVLVFVELGGYVFGDVVWLFDYVVDYLV